MASPPDQDFSHLQDIMGTLPQVKRFIILCLFFSVSDSIELSDTTSTLSEALTGLAKAFPFLAGQVIYDGRDESRSMSGVPKIIPRAPQIQLVIKDYRGEMSFPSLSDLSVARYPMKMLDPAVLVPSLALSWDTDPWNVPAPVLMLQANVVRGGIILTFCGNHTQMDMTGMGFIISFFAKACRGERLTDTEIRQGNQPRREVVPLLGNDYQLGPELDDTMRKPPKPGTLNPLESSPRWAYFYFSPSSLVRLKLDASKQDIVPYVSTDDAIAALCWQRLCAVRSMFSDPNLTSTFTRPISMRKYLDLGDNYISHMVDCVYTTLQSMHTQPLSTIAGHIRKDLQQESKIIHHTRAYATILSRLDDKTAMINGANLDHMRDLVLSSFANVHCCEVSFGDLLGTPLVARQPKIPVFPGLSNCMPKDQDGGIAVAVCTAEEELRALEKDEILKGYAEYVG